MFGTVFVAWKMLAKNVGRDRAGDRDPQQSRDTAYEDPARDREARGRLVTDARAVGRLRCVSSLQPLRSLAAAPHQSR